MVASGGHGASPACVVGPRVATTLHLVEESCWSTRVYSQNRPQDPYSLASSKETPTLFPARQVEASNDPTPRSLSSPPDRPAPVPVTDCGRSRCRLVSGRRSGHFLARSCTAERLPIDLGSAPRLRARLTAHRAHP